MSKRPDANDTLRKHGQEGLRAEFDEAERQKAKANGAVIDRTRIAFTSWDEFAKLDKDNEAWLVEQLLPSQGLAQIYGRWKVFKSFVALDIAVAVARGEPWADKRTRQGTVIYIAAEGARGMRKRAYAYKWTRKLAGLPIHFIERRVNLGALPSEKDELIAAIRALLNGGNPVLIIIDTLAKSLFGKDENGEGMRNFCDACEDIAAALECLVLAVHHEGAAGDIGRSRGASVLPAALVASLHVRKAGELGCTVEIEDAKDSVSGLRFDVTLKVVEFDDERAKVRRNTLMIDQVVPSSAPPEQPPTRRLRPPPSLTAFMAYVDIALNRHGIEVRLPSTDAGATPAKVKAVTIEYLRATYYQKRADLDAGSKRTEFGRQIKAAVERQLLMAGEVSGLPMAWRPNGS